MTSAAPIGSLCPPRSAPVRLEPERNFLCFNRQHADARSFTRRSIGANSQAARQRLAVAIIVHFEVAPPFASEILRARNRP
jgi:hypothetical protein